jgi:hypothetical protein
MRSYLGITVYLYFAESHKRHKKSNMFFLHLGSLSPKLFPLLGSSGLMGGAGDEVVNYKLRKVAVPRVNHAETILFVFL